MPRKLAAAVFAAGVFAVAGCGGGGDDDNNNNEDAGKSPEEICAELDETLAPLEAELATAISEAGAAAEQGDETAVAESAIQLNDLVGQITTALRDGAEASDDEEFGQALEDFAGELETLGMAVASGEGSDVDMTAYGEATAQFEEYCG